MRPRRSLVAGLALLTITAVPGMPCGPFFPEAVFVMPHMPENFQKYVAGQTGIVENTYWTRYLVPAYRQLSGTPLTAEEQKALIVANTRKYEDAPSQEPKLEWAKARTAAGITTKFEDMNYSRIADERGWQVYRNCYDDAFHNATRTLRARQQSYPTAHLELAEWVKGQDAVFSNCDKTGAMPSVLPESAPSWLKQDRAYQIAAAHFYRMELDAARDGFRAIGADADSPWKAIAPYLVARTLIRQALAGPHDEALPPAHYAQAKDLLEPIAHGGGPYAGDAEALLTFVVIHLDPGKAGAMLGDRLSQIDSRVGQDWIDLNYIMQLDLEPEVEADARRSDMVDWIFTMQETVHRADAYQHALERWRTGHSIPWLVAAMSLADTSADKDLFAAAQAVLESSPAYLTLVLHRLRLAQNPKEAYGEADRIILRFKNRTSQSAINHLRQIQRTNASTLHEFVQTSFTVPALYLYDDEEWSPSPDVAAKFLMAGERVNGKNTPRFDLQSALVLNQGLPLTTLAEAVLQGSLPRQLRFELAQATWTRAILLHQPSVAAKLTPVLVAGEPRWKPLLDAYNHAKTEDDRTLAGLMAMMRYPSTRPYVNIGGGRDDGFAGYSYYRDNWWCETRSTKGINWTQFSSTKDRSFVGITYDRQEKMLIPFPPFLTAYDVKEASTQLHTMDTPESGSDRLAEEAIVWAKSHPSDPRTEDLLGFTFRMLRNGCTGRPEVVEGKPLPPEEENLEYQVFHLLNTRYPNSPWTKRYKTWQ
ncbi:hypothetical protein FTW19_01665 [Terriglobus albidus]|uniref:DUF4034 domain-containing protein n=1 Tax=Terriglobus albidus TaxID=1592106 RepID=A0A5B9E3A9_9BACT|nr:hypothetical protein [Terriglobus albidus]QEE26823.1 hypothetical protein FTW19_01665 [Terriglobus albidus]